MWRPIGKKLVGEQDIPKMPKNHPKDYLQRKKYTFSIKRSGDQCLNWGSNWA